MSQRRNSSGLVGPGSGPSISVTDPRIGGVLDGTTDNGPSGRNVCAKAAALLGATGGEIVIPPGVLNFTSQPAAWPSNVRWVGHGKNVSVLQKSFAGEGLVRFEGASTSSRCQRGGLRDLQVRGNGFSGSLVTAAYADHLNFDRVWFYGNAGIGVKFTEVWDSYFNSCEFEQMNGANGLSPAVMLNSSSTDSTNNIWFSQCRWESFKDGALWISTAAVTSAYNLPAGSKPIYGVYLSQCKMETVTVRGPFIAYSADVIDCHVNMLEMGAISLDSGASAANLVNFIPFNFCTFNNVRVLSNGNSVRSVFSVYAGQDGHAIRNVLVEPTTALGVGIIEWAGGNPIMRPENIAYKTGTSGTIYSGTTPTNVTLVDQSSADVQIFTSSGTWTKPAGNPKMTTVTVVAPGGAGGGGTLNTTTTTARGGGAGGGGGGKTQRVFATSVLPSTVAVTVPTAPTGGNGATVTGSTGSVGSSGGTASFGIFAVAVGGSGGSGGGTAIAGTGGTGGLATETGTVGGTGSSGSASGTAGGAQSATAQGATGGGGGGGVTTGNALLSAGSGGSGANAVAVGSNVTNSGLVSQGGAGGAASTSSSGTAGTAGAIYGGGGGGGGAGTATSGGKGGNGGPGIIIVITEY